MATCDIRHRSPRAERLRSTSQGVHVTRNGRPMGAAGLQFARVVLATFIGAEPSTPRLRRELLGLRD